MTRLVKNLKLPVDLQEHYRSFEKTIRESLRSKDVQIRGNSIRLLKALDLDLDDKEKEEVSSDVTEFELYEFDSGSLEKKRICDLI